MSEGERFDAVVVGAGLAGMAAAVRLAEAGRRVCVIETRKRVGGRAASFVDPRTGETIDNCQHVVMGCCASYMDLLERLGTADQIEWTHEQRWVREGGAVDVVAPGLLPAPAHYAGSFARAGFLGLRDKLAVARGMAFVARAKPERWRGRTFADLLAAAGQTKQAIDRFWQPVVVSACNLGIERVDAMVASKVFREGLLASRDAGAIGLSRVPLGELYKGFVKNIECSLGFVRYGDGVSSVDEHGAVLTTGERVEGDRLVCALPVERMVKVLAGADDPRVGACKTIAHSPILGVHLTFDRPVMTWRHAVLVGCDTHWVFRKDGAGTRVHAVISAADAWMGLTESAIVERVVGDLRAWVGDAAGGSFDAAQLVSARAIKEKRATFAATPEAERARPGTCHPDRGPAGGVLLAGDYVRSGWPATMEGAVRSGYLAAGVILDKNPTEMIPPELPPGRLAAVLTGV